MAAGCTGRSENARVDRAALGTSEKSLGQRLKSPSSTCRNRSGLDHVRAGAGNSWAGCCDLRQFLEHEKKLRAALDLLGQLSTAVGRRRERREEKIFEK